MVYYTNANGGVLATAIADVLSRAINAVFDAVQTWNSRRATRIALSKLTDRELDDIGLSRSDINRIARGQACQITLPPLQQRKQPPHGHGRLFAFRDVRDLRVRYLMYGRSVAASSIVTGSTCINHAPTCSTAVPFCRLATRFS